MPDNCKSFIIHGRGAHEPVIIEVEIIAKPGSGGVDTITKRFKLVECENKNDEVSTDG